MYKKIILFIVFLFSGLQILNTTLALEDTNHTENKLPSKLQSILDKYFIKSEKKGYYYNSFGGYIPNAKYTNIIAKEIELIIKQTYEDNKNIYKQFIKEYYGNRELNDFNKLIKSIPQSYGIDNIQDIIFNDYNVSDRLIKSSFDVDYSSNNYDTFLYSIKSKIGNFKYRNGYYPSFEELKEEIIYLNREKKKIGDFIDKIYYKASSKIREEKDFKKYNIIKTKLEKIDKEEEKEEILYDIDKINNHNLSLKEAKEMYKKYKKKNRYHYSSIYDNIMNYIKKQYFQNETYILRYKKIFFTKKEAMADLKKVKKLNIEKKDYKKLVGDTNFDDIPKIYKKIPKNSLFLHIKNPTFLFSFLEDKKNTSNISLQIISRIKDLIKQKVGAESWNEIQSNLKHEIIIVISDLDLISPNFLIILDKKDKGILMPGEKIMAAKSVGNKIYISLSKDILNDYLNINEKDSIYYADDFRYVWYKKQKVQKDIFFFVGDSFFEKITSLDNFIKMKRKVDDYGNLKNLQDYTFALQKFKGHKIQDFNELKNILSLDESKLKNYNVKDSIVTHKRIGNLHDIKNISEIDYNMDKISLEELSSYKENILKYREIWQSTLDPLGIILSKTKDGFKIDFFMTPIPSLNNYEFKFLINIFTNFGKKDFELIKNKKIRIGIIGGVFGFDSDKLKTYFDKKINLFMKNKNNKKFMSKQENKETMSFLKEYMSINSNLFGRNEEGIPDDDILNYMDGEFMFSFGGIDETIFNSFNPEKLDIILAIKFKSKLKAKEFIDILRRKISNETSRYRRDSVAGFMTKMLAKPIGEEYNGNNIYTIPKIPWIGSLYYTILEDVLYISISKNSIKKDIDFYNNPGNKKDKFINNYLTGSKLLYMYFDSDEVKKYINSIFNSNKLSDLYILLKRGALEELGNIRSDDVFIKKYFKDYEYAQLLGNKINEIDVNVGFIRYYTNKGNIFLAIDKNKIKITDLDINKEIQEIFEKLDAKFFTKKGGDILLLKDKKVLYKLYSLNLLNSLLNKDFRNDIIPNNLVFSFGVGNNEIQIKMASFKNDTKKEKKRNIINGGLGNIFMYIIGLLFLIGGGFILYKKREKIIK